MCLAPSPKIAWHFRSRSRLYIEKDRIRAEEALRESLRLDASAYYVHMLYGSVLSEMGSEHHARAEEELLTALSLDPSSPNAHHAYAGFLFNHKKDTAQAKVHCYEALKHKPSDVSYHWLLGHIFQKEGSIEQAEQQFLHALSLDPENAVIHNSYGALLFNQKQRPKEAFEHFKIAILQAPDSPEYRRNFLLALKTKQKFYWLYWHHALLRKKLGRFYLLIRLTLLITVYVCWVMSHNFIPALLPVANVLFWSMILVSAYFFLANPLFNLFFKRGWLK